VIKLKSYTVSLIPSEEKFEKTCKMIEDRYPNAEKSKLLHDVDDTKIQIYMLPEGQIKVYNDFEVYALYVDSDVSLEESIDYLFESKNMQ